MKDGVDEQIPRFCYYLFNLYYYSIYFKGIYSKDNNLRVHLGNINVVMEIEICRLLVNAKYPKIIIVFIFHSEIYLQNCVLRNSDIFI